MSRRISRRTLLRSTALSGAAVATGSLWAPSVASAMTRSLAMAASPDGTTLVSALMPTGDGPYFRLTPGPGWPTVVRELGATAGAGREDTRRAIASIVHLTDVHIVDGQSPARVEFLDRDSDPPQEQAPVEGAWRAHEMLCTQISDAMNQQVRSIGAGPITGRAYDCAVSTGDNVDNMQLNELDWFIKLLDGGEQLTPNSGDLERYEGVQDDEQTTYDLHYWHPNPSESVQGDDRYKTIFGFPVMEGLLDLAIQPFTPVGLGVPWYSAYGNHDGLLQGNAPTNEGFNGIATGSFKVTSRPAGSSGTLADGLMTQDPTAAGALFSGPGRPVTADADRIPMTIQQWVQAHLDSPAAPGPVGHGYSEDALESLQLYYTFEVAEGVLGICLDTVNRGGYAEGSIGEAQFAWLEQQLIDHSSSYYDSAGTLVDNPSATDHLIVLFSHHNMPTLNNPNPDPSIPEERVQAGPFEELLHRFDNVVAWVNGHSHVNRVTPFPDPAGNTGGFWEVSTAAHIDYPMHARIVELVDNGDGTLSIFGTLLEHAGPAQAELAGDVLSLASIARELGFNDPQRGEEDGLGADDSRNVELVLRAPFPLGDVGEPTTGGTAEQEDDPSGDLAATGAGALGLAALSVSAAVALRNRDTTSAE